MAYVVLPQAVRNVLPDLVSNTLEVVKLTSIASVVALPELLFQARQAQSVTYNPTPIVAAAVAYFLLLWPVGAAGQPAGKPRHRGAALMRLLWLAMLAALSACATSKPPPDAHVPPFARVPYEPISREAVVAIALREWRLFGQPVDDDPPGTRPPPAPEDKPEREHGLWQRVGEYWWLGLNAGAPEAGWTGKHDAQRRGVPGGATTATTPGRPRSSPT